MINNRLTALFEKKKSHVLTIYFTAGFPQLHDTCLILEALSQSGADIIEIGMPFSDPIADGETIQISSQKALENGMSIKLLFEQIRDIRQKTDTPILLMGYLNPVMQYGIDKFAQDAAQIGIDGFILPDLPLSEYLEIHKSRWDALNLSNVFLITPQTSEERIRLIDKHSQGFIYVVSSSSTTGKTEGISQTQEMYFQRLQAMQLQNPCLIGFGIADKASFQKACQYANGAIIGSAFIKAIAQTQALEESVKNFMKGVL
jgi:tryptophan synthase alpha chain